jgi:hypothetical protein
MVDSAIKPYTRTPKAFVKNKTATAPGPITWDPEETDFRSQNPGARHPVIVIAPGPITRRPDVTLARAKRLLVDW